MLEQSQANRICKICNVMKPLNGFHGKKNANGKTYWAHQCIECLKPISRNRKKSWYYADPERAKADSRAWYENNKSRALAAVMIYRSTRKDWAKQYHKKWRDQNPAKMLAWCRKYQAAKLRAVPGWADHKKIQSIYDDARAQGLEVDHIVPLRSKIVCGLHVEHNLQILPPAVNNSKGNRWWPDMP